MGAKPSLELVISALAGVPSNHGFIRQKVYELEVVYFSLDKIRSNSLQGHLLQCIPGSVLNLNV